MTILHLWFHFRVFARSRHNRDVNDNYCGHITLVIFYGKNITNAFSYSHIKFITHLDKD